MCPLINPLVDEIGVQKEGMSKKDRMMLTNPAEDFDVVMMCVRVHVCMYVYECAEGESHVWALLILQSGPVLSM